MFRKFFLILIALIFIFSNSKSQNIVKDSNIFIPMFYACYSYQFPGGDLVNRFGDNSNIGGGFQIKFKRNWIIGLEFNYLFGGKVKGETELFKNISTPDDYIIDGNGQYAEVFLYERGYYPSIKVGKIIPLLSPNPNSGFYIYVTGGYLIHKIRINNPGNVAPQISGEYRKGYDHLTNGWGISEFIGYMFFGNNRLLSFYGGIEYNQAWTKCRRYNFDTQSQDPSTHFDQLVGIKVGWIIPLYKKRSRGYYFN